MSIARFTQLILLAAMAAVPSANAFKTFRLAGGNIHEQISQVALTAPAIDLQPPALKEIDVGNIVHQFLASCSTTTQEHSPKEKHKGSARNSKQWCDFPRVRTLMC